MDKKDKNDIRKEIEELEKLINKVKKQNEEEKKKHTPKPRNRVIKINLASSYSNNFWINMVFSFLINFIVIFGLLKLFDFAIINNDVYIIYIVGAFTVLEEGYRRYLFMKQPKIVIFTSGLIFTLLNIIIFYLIDLAIPQAHFAFLNYLHPISFVVVFQLIRTIIKNIYLRITHRQALNKIKRR